MPTCILLGPESTRREAKVAMMAKLTSHIDETYPVTPTHVFVRETDRGDVMLGGSLQSELPSGDLAAFFGPRRFSKKRAGQNDHSPLLLNLSAIMAPGCLCR